MSRQKLTRWKPASLLAGFLIVLAMPFMALVPASADPTFTAISNTEIDGNMSTTCQNVVFTGSGGTFTGTCSPENCVQFHTTGTCGDSQTWTITNVASSNGSFTGTLHDGSTTSNITIAANGQKTLGGTAVSTGSTGTTGTTSCNTTGDGTGNCTASNPDTLSCTSGSGFFTAVLNWILCGAINLAWGAANILDNWIMNTLDVDVSGIFDNTGNASNASHGYYVAWNSFRIIATAILVIGGLIMVTAQALGFEALDAYTVRKVLPRLLIAVIGISLSWPLMRLVVYFFDTAGLDIREIMYAPFNTPAMHGTVSAGVGIFTTLGVTAALFVMGPASLTFLLTAMLAAFVGFLILVIRQIAIVMLVILAPVAIACYILPNTQRIWKLWYDNFLGLMLMFPIISALIAAGHIFSAVTLKGGVGGGVVAQAIGLIAYFAPYFLLPMAARMATGVIGNIAGFVNDKHRGAFDRLKGARQNATQRNVANMKAGTRFNNGALNALTARASTPFLGYGRRGRESYDNKMALAAGEFAKSRHGMGAQFKDPVLQAKTYRSEAEARQRLAADFGMNNPEDVEKAIAGAKASGGFGAAQQVWAAKQLAATGTGYDSEAHMLSTIARVAGNNDVLADSMWGEMRGTSERAGRNDLKAGYGTGSKILQNIRSANATRGSAMTAQDLEDDTSVGGFQAQLQDFGVEAARGVDNYSAMSRNKPKSVGNMMKRMDQARGRYQRTLDQETLAPGSVSAGQLEQARVASGQIQAKMENLEGYKGSGPEANAEALYGARKTADGSAVGNIQLSGERSTVYTRAHAGAEYATFSGEEQAQRAFVEESTPRGGHGGPDDHSPEATARHAAHGGPDDEHH